MCLSLSMAMSMAAVNGSVNENSWIVPLALLLSYHWLHKPTTRSSKPKPLRKTIKVLGCSKRLADSYEGACEPWMVDVCAAVESSPPTCTQEQMPA